MPAIGSHSTGTTDVAWDGPANEARLPNARAALRSSHAWYDPGGDPDAKATYRFIHHMVGGDGRVGAANTRAASTGIGVLNGGRGGTTIPAGDRSGVYAHLAAHLRAANMEPPDLQGGGRSYKEVDQMAVSTAVAERRITTVAVEARAGKEQHRTIGGYAATANKLSQNLGGFVERSINSTFLKSRGDGWADVLARYNHDDNMLLGTTAGRTLRLQIDDVGLLYEVDLPQARGDVYELVTRGDVQKSSYAFRVPAGGDEWTVTDQGYPLRTLLSVQLVDVAPVNTPAYLDSSVSARALVDPAIALRSLAEKVEAELVEVQAAAQANELHRFLVDTGSNQPMPKPAKRRLSGAAALARIREREIT